MLAAQTTKSNRSTVDVNRHEKSAEFRKNSYADDEIRLAKMIEPVNNEIDSINKLITRKDDPLHKSSESSSKNIVQLETDNLNKISEQLIIQRHTIQFNFIRNNPSSFFSLDRLSLILMRSAELPQYDTIKSLFYHLASSIQNSVSGKKFKLLLATKKKNEVGNLASDFLVKDINSRPISLASFRGKNYVLLDFWASWCKPCRDDIPSLKEIYKRYNEKGLEIIGISEDDNSLLWKKAVEKDSTQLWRHILVSQKVQKIDTLITDKYFVFGIPVKVLINKEGIIIGRWTGGGKENIAELEKLLNKNLDK